MDLVAGIFIFIIVILIAEAINLALRIRSNPELKRIRHMLRALSAEAYRKEIVNITRKLQISAPSLVDTKAFFNAIRL